MPSMFWRPYWVVLALLLAASINPHAFADPPVSPHGPKVLPHTGPRPPWKRRRRVGVRGMRGKGQGLVDLSLWPAEPASPATVDVQRFASVLRQLCHDWMPPRRPAQFSRWILESSKQFGVDPFLLAALIYRQSRCLPRLQTGYGVGLAMINPRMHGPHVRKRKYNYWVLADGRWQARQLALPRFALVKGNLRRAQPSIYFAAALLSIYKQQCPALDGSFGSVPHRHFVSHFMWGDRVLGAGAEDRVLRARRRMLEYYTNTRTPPRAKFKSLQLGCPLDAPPRKVTSGMGRDRDGGVRLHKGVDFGSTLGEPVRAVADGRVSFAGVDRRVGSSRNVPPGETGTIRRDEMGAGGLFVMIRHTEGLVSAYMHLASYTVKAGQQVKVGELIGHVGRSGFRDPAGAHLHFELRHEGRHIDPVPHLKPHIFVPEQTYRGRGVIVEEKRRRRHRRHRRWQQHKARTRAGQKKAR